MIGANNTVDVYALVDTSGKFEYSGTALFESLSVYIEKVDPKLAAIVDGQNVFNTYSMIVEDELSWETDYKVVDAQGNEYKVTGFQDFTNNTDVPNHVEVTMVKLFQQ